MARTRGDPVTEKQAGRSPDDARPGAALLRLVEVMDTLRVNCPWDARQTHRSLAPYLLEECYEALEALEGGDEAALRDELGDVLLQVVFHARVAAERTDGTGFDIDDVATGIVEKLIRRHPHVFGDVQVSGPEDVKRNWDAIKAAERGGRGGALPAALGSVPFGQPALSLAAQLQRRAERSGVPAELADLPVAAAADARGPDGSTADAQGRDGSTADAQGRDGSAADAQGPDGSAADGQAPSGEGGDGQAPDGSATDGQAPDGVSEIGAALFSLVARARAAGLDPELELRAAARSYRDRVRRWAEQQNGDPA
jgi:XTP/dITP diphosphohydrolase